MYMRLIKLLEGICIRKDGESDEEFVQRCGNELTREPDMWNDRETSGIKLQKLMAKKKLPKDMKWNQGFELEEDGMPGGAFVGLVSPQGYINGAPSQKKKKKEEDIVNDNEVDRNDVLFNKLNKALIKIRKRGNVLESHVFDCPKCGHTWEADKGGQDETICHKCGHNLYQVKEGDINKPSPKLRPEPHPTRHETEHPPYEKDAMKPKPKYTPPSKK
jgi:predicted Zn-ribbon and HTH transcriptional regulator